MRIPIKTLTCLGLSMGLALPALANEPPPAKTTKVEKARDPAKAAGTAQSDIDLVTEISQASMKEIEASQIAANATRMETRDFAKMMIKEHGKAADELKALSAKKAITPPAILTDSARKKVDSLSKEQGMDLDRAYISMMIDDHEDAVDLFEKAAKDAKDTDLQAWATKTLPTIRAHLRMANDLKAKLDQLSRRGS